MLDDALLSDRAEGRVHLNPIIFFKQGIEPPGGAGSISIGWMLCLSGPPVGFGVTETPSANRKLQAPGASAVHVQEVVVLSGPPPRSIRGWAIMWNFSVLSLRVETLTQILVGVMIWDWFKTEMHASTWWHLVGTLKLEKFQATLQRNKVNYFRRISRSIRGWVILGFLAGLDFTSLLTTSRTPQPDEIEVALFYDKTGAVLILGKEGHTQGPHEGREYNHLVSLVAAYPVGGST
ncbi:hypothetical protein B0H19DRAFT_1055743 [Mycena capillaripes]|nr:hypothetical protein B0H19DRAFT_1055743 [Mycena capillaripes]